MALHGNATLREAHGQPMLDPKRPITNDILVSGQGLKVRARLEQGQTSLQNPAVNN